jgi:hypothetical protein
MIPGHENPAILHPRICCLPGHRANEFVNVTCRLAGGAFGAAGSTGGCGAGDRPVRLVSGTGRWFTDRRFGASVSWLVSTAAFRAASNFRPLDTGRIHQAFSSISASNSRW